MPDIFDFISTRLEPTTPVVNPTVPNLGTPSLLGNVPADLRSETKVSPLDFISQRISALPDNSPAYSYTQKQEERYSNPNLQFTPYTTLGTDTEDIYGRYQGAGEQLWNALLKTKAIADTTFISHFLTLPATLDLIRSGKIVEAFEDDSLFAVVQNWLSGIEDKLPNYYTEWEREHPYLSAITPTGAANFWGDKVIKNIGFTIGSLGAGLVEDAAIELLSDGAATPVTFIALANQIRKVPSNLFRGFRNLSKAAQTVEGIDQVIGAAKVSKNLYKGLSVPTLAQISKGSKFAAISYLSAQGESFIEGYHTYLDVKKALLEETVNTGGVLTPNILQDIEQKAQNAGRWTTGLNLPVLMASNLVQFPSLLYGKSVFGKTLPFIESQITKEGLQLTSNYTFKKGLKQWALESFKDSLSEGGEEAAQYFISNSLHDYYVDKLNPNVKEGLLGFTLSNAKNILNDPQMYEEAFLGALSGLLMGAPASANNLKSNKSRYDSLVSHLNSNLDRFNSTVKNFSSTIELNNLEGSEKEIAAHKNIYSIVHDSLKFGTYETFLDSLNDLKTVELDSFNQTFDTQFENESDKVNFVNSLISEAEQIKQNVQNVEQFFPTNPYSKPYLAKKIYEAFSDKTQIELENLQESLFSEFKEVVGYNQSLQRVTNNRSLQYQNELKTLGVKNEAIGFLGSIANPKGLFQYSRWKKEQIKNLQETLDYYSEFQTLDFETRKEKERIEKELKRSSSFYEVLDKLYQKLKQDPKNKELQNLINTLVLTEEVSEEQFTKFEEELNTKTEELQKTEQQAETLKEEEKDLFNEESQTAEKLIELNQTAEELAKPSEKQEVPEVPVDPNKWVEEYKIDDTIYIRKKPFTVIAVTKDSLIVKSPTGNYVVTKEQGRWVIKGTTPLYEFGETSNRLETDEVSKINENIEPDPVEEYLAPSEPTTEVKQEVVPSLSLGDEFTPEQVFQSENTVWIRSKDTLDTANFIYTMENGWLIKRTFWNGRITDQTKSRFSSAERLPSYLKDNFKQVLRNDERPLTIEPVIENSVESNIKVFIGQDYINDKLLDIFVSKIENNTFELDCK